MAIGPIARVLIQGAVMGVSILARALPAAYGAALRNARKGGMDAASEGAVGGGVFAKKRMMRDEAMAVLNLTEGKGAAEVDLEAVRKQYDKYFAANAVEKGGSFYLQSKIYRAKEMLDDYINEKEAERAANKQADGGGQTDNHEDKQEKQ